MPRIGVGSNAINKRSAQRFWPVFEIYQADSCKLLIKMISLPQRFHAQPAPRSGDWSKAAIDAIYYYRDLKAGPSESLCQQIR